MRKVYALVVCVLFLLPGLSWGQNVSATWGSNANTAWYTATNWTGGAYAGVAGAAVSNTNLATFTNSSTGGNLGINLNNTGNGHNLGAIEATNARSQALNIGDNSATPGTLRLYGTTVNGIANVIIRNNSTGLITLQGVQAGVMGVLLGNTTNNIINIDNTGGVTISSLISGAGRNLTKAGSGTGVLTLTNTANSYTGTTTVSTGELRLNPTATATTFASSQMILNGGTLSTTNIILNTNINASTATTLNLNASSTIALGSNVHSLRFAASNLITWNGTDLNITGWTGTAGTSGTAGRIYVGNSATGLTAAQLAKISFAGFTGGAAILATGEVVPSINPTLTVAPVSRTGFTYAFGFGPSTSQTFALSGTYLTGFPDDITVTASADYEVSSDDITFSGSLTVPYSSATLSSTTLYVRLKSGLSVGTYSGDVTCSGGGASVDAILNCDGSVTPFYSSTSDVIAVAASEPNTISSTINDPAPLSSVTGVKVWEFTIRDGGAGSPDADNLPTIVNSIVFAQAAGNAVSDWSQAIKTISLFDGATLVATGTVTANQVQFTGLSYSVPDDGSKTLAVRLSLNCGIGGANKDGDDFGFSLSNANFTTASNLTSSQKTTFPAIVSLNGKNVIEVIATKLVFGQQPQATIAINSNFSPAVTVIAQDACGNIDLGYTTAISITSTGTMISTPINSTPSLGTASFPGIAFTATGGPFTLTASSGGLTTAISNPFTVIPSTALNAGDLMFVGFDTYIASGGDDKISLANFVPVLPNTTFTIGNVVYDFLAPANIKQDRWYNGNSGIPFSNGPAFAKFTYIGATNLATGSVICIVFGGSPPTGMVKDITVNGVSSMANFTVTTATGANGYTSATNVNISSTQPDCLFLMQGDFIPATTDYTDGTGNKYRDFNGKVFGGIQFRGSFQPFSVAGNAGGDRVSRIHPQIECVAFGMGTSTDAAFYGYYKAAPAAIHSGSHRNLIKAVADNVTNWTKGVTSGTSPADGDNLASNNTCTNTFTVTLNVSPGSWVGDKSTDWYDCNNWDDFNVPTSTTDVLISNTSFGNAVIDNNGSPKAAQFGNIADAKSVTINGRQLLIRNTGAIQNVLNVAGDILINTNSGLNMSDAVVGTLDGRINIGGNWTNNFSTGFIPGESLINFNGTIGTQTITTPDGETFYDVTNNNTSTGVDMATGAANITINNLLTLTSTPLAINNNTLTLKGTIAGAGTLTGSNNSNLIINGTVGGNLGTFSFTAGGQFLDNLTLNRTGAGAAATLGSNLSVNTLATITAGILDAGTNTLNGAAGLTMTGGELQLGKTGVTLPELAGTYGLTGGAVNFKGSGDQTIKAINYFNLTSTSTGNRIMANSGTIGIASTFTPGTNAYTFTGSTVDYNGTVNQNIAPFTSTATTAGQTYNNLILSGLNTKSLTANTDVEGALTLNDNVIFRLNSGNLTLRSLATQTAMLAPVLGGASVNYSGPGRFVVERYLSIPSTTAARRWRLLTAPISAAGAPTINAAWQEGQTNVNRFAPSDLTPGYGTIITKSIAAANGYDQGSTNNPSLYKYGSGTWATPFATNTGTIKNEQGYMIFVRGNRNFVVTSQYVPGSITTLRVKGQLNIGSVNVNLDPSDFKVIGNPYASAITFNEVTVDGASPKTAAGISYYLWDPKFAGTNNVGGFVTFTSIGNGKYVVTANGSGYPTDNSYVSAIESSVAFMMPAGNGSIDFGETSKIAVSSNQGVASRPVEDNTSIIPDMEFFTTNLLGNANGNFVTIDGVVHIGNNNFDNNVTDRDAPKLLTFQTSDKVSILKDTKKLSVETRKRFTDADTVYYSLSRLVNISYKFEFIRNGLDKKLTAILKDRYTGEATVMPEADTTLIPFTTTADAASTDAQRFKVVFKNAVNWQKINAATENTDVKVNWELANEFNVDFYQVERSDNNNDFTAVAKVNSKGNSEIPTAYDALDYGLTPGVYYYRVKSVTKAGYVLYSDVVKIRVIRNTPGFFVFPNPVTDNNINLQLNNAEKGTYKVKLVNASGQLMMQKQIVHPGGSVTHTLKADQYLAAGTYQLEVAIPGKKATVIGVVVKNR